MLVYSPAIKAVIRCNFYKGIIMNTKRNNNTRSIFVFVLILLLSMLSMNSHAGVNVVGWGGHHHPHGGYGPGPGPGPSPYWGGGGGFYFGGGWAGPNVVINIPAEPYYAPPPPVCQTVEVCDPYDECWIERQCA